MVKIFRDHEPSMRKKIADTRGKNEELKKKIKIQE